MPASVGSGKFGVWWTVLKTAGSEFFTDKAPRMSAALAYYTAFALAPMLVIAVFVVRIFIRNSEEARSQVVAAMGQVIGGMSPEQAQQILAAADKQGSGIMATIVSIILAIIGATGVFGELQDSLNTIWDVKPKPGQGIWGFIRTRLFSLAMVLSIAFILLTSLAVSTVLTGVSEGVTGGSQAIGHILDFAMSVAVTFVLFGLIFKVLPDVKLTWAKVWRGALVTAVLFTIGKILLGVYLAKGSATSAFGAAASLAALLIWVNYSAWILFFGAEVTKAYALAIEHDAIEPSEHAIRMQRDEGEQRQPRDEIPATSSAPVVVMRAKPTNIKDVLLGIGAMSIGAVAATYVNAPRRAQLRRPCDPDERLANRLRDVQREVLHLERAKRSLLAD